MISELLAAALLLSAATPVQPQAEPKNSRPAASSAQEQLAAGYAAFKADDCVKATPLLRSALEGGVSATSESLAHTLIGLCAVRDEKFDEAYEALTRATIGRETPKPLPPEIWHLRLQVAAWAQRPADVATTMEQMAARMPAAVSSIEDEAIDSAWRSLFQADAADRRRFLAVLDATGYAPKSPLRRMDWAWATYAELLFDAGQAREAERLARRVEDTDLLIDMRLDRRFARLVAAEPARFDVRVAAERDLARSRRLYAAHPDLLEAAVGLATSLRAVGRDEEALQVLNAADARLARPNAFSDADDYRNWLLNELAYTLQSLGRTDEAVAAMTRAAAIDERGAPNVSQTINLAALLNSVGRPREALAALAPFTGAGRDASPVGHMFVASERVCAHAQLGDAAAMAAPLAYTAEHARDNPAARARALLCADDLDGAAAAYIDRLADPDERPTALKALSRPEASPHRGAYSIVLNERLDRVRARADVQAAIARVGRIESLPIRATYWGDI